MSSLVEIEKRKKELENLAKQIEKAAYATEIDLPIDPELARGKYRLYINMLLGCAVLTAVFIVAASYLVIFRESGEYFITTLQGKVIQIHPSRVN